MSAVVNRIDNEEQKRTAQAELSSKHVEWLLQEEHKQRAEEGDDGETSTALSDHYTPLMHQDRNMAAVHRDDLVDLSDGERWHIKCAAVQFKATHMSKS